MATTRDKLLASAQRQVDKGNLARAVRDYQKLLEVQPDDTRTRLRIGDLQARMGKKEEAIATYEQVARDYADQGFFLKAVAILKQILRLDPARIDVQVRLADLYLRLNLLSDCMAQYRKVADHFSAAGDQQRYVDVLRRMTQIDPEDVRVQITLAEHFTERGNATEAAAYFRHAAEGLANQERWDEYIKVAERYVFLVQDDLAATKDLARVYVERRDFKRALAKLQLAFKIDASDIEGLDLLARSFLGIGRQEKALRVLKELADILMADGRDSEALDAYQRVLDIEPYDLDARVHLGLSMPSGIPLTQTAEEALPEAPRELRYEGSKPILMTDLPSDGPEQWRRLKAQSGLFATPTGLFTCNSSVSEAALEEIGRLIVEIDGFEKLGLIERARTALKRVFELDPLNISAMERAVRIDLARGSIEGGIQRLLRMTRLCWRPDPVRAAGYLNEALKHDPDHPSGLQLRGELGLDGIDLETFMLESSDAEVIEVGDISGLGDSVAPLRGTEPHRDYVYEVVDTMGSDAGGEVFIEVDANPFSEADDDVLILEDEEDDDLYEIELDEPLQPPTFNLYEAPSRRVPREPTPVIEIDDIEVEDVDVDDDLGISDDDLFLEPDETFDDSGAADAAVTRRPARQGAREPDPAALLSAVLAGPRGRAAKTDPHVAQIMARPPSTVMRGTPKTAHHSNDVFATRPDERLASLPRGLPGDLLEDLEELTFFMKAGMRHEAQTLLFDLTTEHPEHTVLIMERMAALEEAVPKEG